MSVIFLMFSKSLRKICILGDLLIEFVGSIWHGLRLFYIYMYIYIYLFILISIWHKKHKYPQKEYSYINSPYISQRGSADGIGETSIQTQSKSNTNNFNRLNLQIAKSKQFFEAIWRNFKIPVKCSTIFLLVSLSGAKVGI